MAGDSPALDNQEEGWLISNLFYYFHLLFGVHTHRFYCDDSSFVHGGVDPDGNPEEPVFGQQVSH